MSGITRHKGGATQMDASSPDDRDYIRGRIIFKEITPEAAKIIYHRPIPEDPETGEKYIPLP